MIFFELSRSGTTVKILLILFAAEAGSQLANQSLKCVGYRDDLCRDSLGDCWVRSLIENCVCAAGYGAQELGMEENEFAVLVRYTCCPNHEGLAECGKYSKAKLKVLMGLATCTFILSLVGVALLTTLQASAMRPPFTRSTRGEGDARPVLVQDGQALHRDTPMEKWCLTLQDLLNFRSRVWRAIQAGTIYPTESDPFDPADYIIGPNMYTVNEQFVKPVTAANGNASWALMCHPEGLRCDLFISHGWAEGVFDFIAKVEDSWPRGAKHAYCCMLSNPQNLDVSSLIASPKDSPFAKALESSSWVLVVPNHVCSVYQRLWCSYEMFLAHSSGKFISTAVAPVIVFWVHICRECLFFLASFTLTSSVLAGLGLGSLSSEFPEFLALTIIIFFFGTFPAYLYYRTRYSSIKLRIIIISFAFIFGAAASLLSINANWSSITSIVGVVLQVMALWLVCVALEADRLFGQAERVQSQQLRKDFSGSFRDAECSCPVDGGRIRHEITENKSEVALDEAVTVLIDMGMLTPSLSEVVKRAGKKFQSTTDEGQDELSCVHALEERGVLGWNGAIDTPEFPNFSEQPTLLGADARKFSL